MPSPILSGLRTTFNSGRRALGHTFGMRSSLLIAAKGTRILVYHGLCRQDLFHYNTLFIHPATLEEQLRLYKKYCRIISLDQLYAGQYDRDEFNICLSFDDGFANNYKYVLPLLEQYEAPATFFITAIREAGYDTLWNDVLSIAGVYGPAQLQLLGQSFIRDRHGKYRSATGHYLNDILRARGFADKATLIDLLGEYRYKANEDQWRQMTIAQIRVLANSKWASIGSHSYYHNDLAQLDEPTLADDLQQSKQYLENITGKEIKALAFPYGSYTPLTIHEAKKAGYTQLLATEDLLPGDESDASIRPRLTINPFISPLNQLYATISGHYR